MFYHRLTDKDLIGELFRTFYNDIESFRIFQNNL